MIEFQKNQCFFAGAIQIENLVHSAGQSQTNLEYATPDLLDESFLYVIATNGFIPTIFTLTLITRFGRLSWYLILLSGSVLGLSITSLAATQTFWTHFFNYWTDNDGSVTNNRALSCGSGELDDLTSLLCRGNGTLSNPELFSISPKKWIWLAWTNALLWFLCCVTKQYLAADTRASKTAKLTQIWQRDIPRNLPFQRYLTARLWNRLSQIVFTTTWTASFGYQFYLTVCHFADRPSTTAGALDKSWPSQSGLPVSRST